MQAIINKPAIINTYTAASCEIATSLLQSAKFMAIGNIRVTVPALLMTTDVCILIILFLGGKLMVRKLKQLKEINKHKPKNKTCCH